jgi:hypothetical protein
MTISLDTIAVKASAVLIRWISHRLHPSRAEWAEALATEAEHIESGWDKLRWAVNGLPLAWTLHQSPEAHGALNMRIRETLASLNQRGADLWSAAVSLGLATLMVFFAVIVTPLFMQIAAQFGLPLPLPARIVIVASRNSVTVTVLLALLVVLLWRRGRRDGEHLPIRRLLLTMNVVSVLALAGLTTGLVTTMVAAKQSLSDARRERAEQAERQQQQQRVERLRAAKAFELPPDSKH